MGTDRILTTLMLVVVVAILGYGGYLFVGSNPQPSESNSEQAGASAPEQPSSASPDRADGPTKPSGQINDCPVTLDLPVDFKAVPPPESGRLAPKARYESRQRGLTVDVACRTSPKDFDPAQFQHDLVRGMKVKHKDAFQGRSALEVANAQGASYLIETDEGTVFNNVLVDGRHIVIIKVMGPSTEIAEPFNDALFEGRVGWTG
jgi:hypothetical protein